MLFGQKLKSNISFGKKLRQNIALGDKIHSLVKHNINAIEELREKEPPKSNLEKR